MSVPRKTWLDVASAVMRVIAGEFGGRKLLTPDGVETRPTTDKVRQAVFNSLSSMGVIDGALTCDLFAGCGSMGIEALSRGAQHCVFVERDRNALAALRENLDTLGLQARATVIPGNVMSGLAATTAVDVAFVDPPYTFADWEELLGGMQAGLVVAESDRDVAPGGRYDLVRSRRYGRTRITIFEQMP